MEKQVKKIAVEIKGFREEEREGVKYAYVMGWGGVNGNIDLGYDVIEKGAYAKTLNDRKGRVPFLADHKAELASTLGVAMLKEEDYGLYGEYEVNLGTEAGKEAYALAKQFKEHGLPMGLSIGYSVVKEEYETRMGKSVRVIKELKLYEVSMTLFPMNEKAVLTDVKSLLASYGENSYISVKAVQSLLQEAGQTTSDKAEEAKSDEDMFNYILLSGKIHSLKSEIQNVRRT